MLQYFSPFYPSHRSTSKASVYPAATPTTLAQAPITPCLGDCGCSFTGIPESSSPLQSTLNSGRIVPSSLPTRPAQNNPHPSLQLTRTLGVHPNTPVHPSALATQMSQAHPCTRPSGLCSRATCRGASLTPFQKQSPWVYCLFSSRNSPGLSIQHNLQLYQSFFYHHQALHWNEQFFVHPWIPRPGTVSGTKGPLNQGLLG